MTTPRLRIPAPSIVLVSASLIVAGGILGAMLGLAGIGEATDEPGIGDPMRIFAHNAGLGVVLVAGALTLGVTTVLSLVAGSYAVGMAVGGSIRTRGWFVTNLGLVPHGVFEVAGFVALGALGLLTLDALCSRLFPGWYRAGSAWDRLGPRGCALIAASGFGLLLLGAAVEATVTLTLMERYR